MAVSKNAFQRYRIIDECIRSTVKPFPSKQELRRICEDRLFGTDNASICDSTIEKDLKYMRAEHDAPICYNRLENGYFYSEDEYSLDNMPLTEGDVEAIKAAANILSQFKSNPLFKQFETAIDKITNRVTISNDVQDNAIEAFVQFETGPKIEGAEYLELILKAIKKKSVIQFEYQSFQKEKTAKIRRVHPYLLKEYNNRWYLIGKSELKNKVITYALDRVVELSVLSQLFLMDERFSADQFFKHAFGITTSDKSPVDVVVEVDEVLSKYIRSQPLHHSQKYEGERQGKHVFSYYLLLTYELKARLLGFGHDLKVVSPKELIEDIKNEGMKMVELYN